MLRQDLTARALQYARAHGLLHDLSPGSGAGVVFGVEVRGVDDRDDRDDRAPAHPARHGNFHPAAYQAICANPEWLRRLGKPHTASRRSVARKDWRWMELDSAISSDALLMNVFCHPEVFDGERLAERVAALLNIEPEVTVCFGERPGVPLQTALKPRSAKAAPRERLDRTEIDLTLTGASSKLFIEAKLTESDFQNAAPALIERYRDLEAVFDLDRLPRKLLAPPPLPANVDPDDPTVNLPARPARMRFASYQLIRNTLAAYAADASFCVLCDARRCDLIASWYSVLSAVRSHSFSTRLKLLTWQELSVVLPREVRIYLDGKYGIVG
jgi:hypothetical protein